MFKQAVTSEDMYLQMRGKNPSSSSCEDLVVSKGENSFIRTQFHKQINKCDQYFIDCDPQKPIIISYFLLELITGIAY